MFKRLVQISTLFLCAVISILTLHLSFSIPIANAAIHIAKSPPPVILSHPIIKYSKNWAGIVTKPGQYNEVQGNWRVPSYTGYQLNQEARIWVGLGGYGPETLVQLEESDVPGNGQSLLIAEVVTHEAYYIAHNPDPNPDPNDPNHQPICAIASDANGEALDCQRILPLKGGIHPGDFLEAKIVSKPNHAFVCSPSLSGCQIVAPFLADINTFSIENKTTHQSQNLITWNWPATSASTAEWIVEKLTTFAFGTNIPLPLANFDLISFSGYAQDLFGTEKTSVLDRGNTLLTLRDDNWKVLAYGSIFGLYIPSWKITIHSSFIKWQAYGNNT